MTERELVADGFEHAGNFSVDAGLCMIGDPCYYIHADEPPTDLGRSWSEFCDKLGEAPFDKNRFMSLDHNRGHEGLGVLVSTGYGDGCYPVYVRKNSDGRVAEVRILFIEEE